MLQLRFPTAAETQHDDNKLAYAAATTSYDCPPFSLQVPTLQTMPQPIATAKAKHQGNKASTRNSTSGGDVAPPAHTAVRHAVAFLIKGPLPSTICQKWTEGDACHDCLHRSIASTYVELRITFYPHDEKQAPKVVKVVMPKTWAPKMCLAALNKSIKRHLILSLESMSLQGRTYTTINELQWLFSATE
jgi:hypothetical protein